MFVVVICALTDKSNPSSADKGGAERFLGVHMLTSTFLKGFFCVYLT